ncbi:DUF2937 family protein [Alteromonas sp. ASW11-36]|uniref:DUF2937 family protein n=1 Tax=Alteromonas arenosi TaxID=3055817 RepID=A0ABT7T0G9_9ALTE|nr:DUF2937 family protein [Alteromonas sp. ASW11-36]MDM7861936.1 DUF2937 family protein [Alteromonas sp. ASW11-36]
MIAKLVSKLLFAAVLLLLFQVPILNQQYVQYLSGYIDANQKQIDALEILASNNGYPSVDTLLAQWLSNSDPVIRADAQNKQTMLVETEKLRGDLVYLRDAHYFQALLYFINPANAEHLPAVWRNFKPGIPLTIEPLLFSVLLALVFSGCGSLCWRVVRTKKRGDWRSTVS